MVRSIHFQFRDDPDGGRAARSAPVGSHALAQRGRAHRTWRGAVHGAGSGHAASGQPRGAGGTAVSNMRVILPDGSERELAVGASARDLAAAIGPGLAKAALAARVNGQIRDLGRPLEDGATVSLLTDRDPDALEVLRHSAAHILATAVRELFPNAGIGFGPPIEDGFYYDFQVDRPFTPEDLSLIEAKMAEVAARDYPFTLSLIHI